MNSDFPDEFDERLRRMMAEARRMEEQLTRALKEFEHAENCMVPLHELRPTADGYSLTVDLPGVEKEEVTLTLKGDFIQIRAPCKSMTARRRKGAKEPRYLIEVQLPANVEAKSVRASMKNGLLKVDMKKLTGGYEIKVE